MLILQRPVDAKRRLDDVMLWLISVGRR